MKNAAFWDVTLVRTGVSEDFLASIIRAKRIRELLVIPNVVHSSLILFTLMM
jgi:hypothetical protein